MQNQLLKQLLKQLNHLYYRLIRQDLKNREASFQVSAFAEGRDAVLPELEHYLNRTAQSAVDPVTSEPGARALRDMTRFRKPATTLTRLRNGLADHFKKKRPATQLRPRISLELERETWKHIHKALRYAGEGDMNNAHLHGQIAVEAMHELSHYLPEEHYEKFREQVLQRLEEMYQSIEQSVIDGEDRAA